MNYEAILLALILRNEDIWYLAGMRLEFFQTPIGRAVFAAMEQAMNKSGYISRDTVAVHLPDPSMIDKINKEAEAEVSTARWEFHRQRVLRSWKQRALIESYNEAREAIEDNDADPDELSETIISSVQGIRSEHAQDASVSYKQRVMEVLDHLRAMRDIEGLPGLETSVRGIDSVTGGYRPEALTIIAARPSQGKSALLGQSADNLARQGIPIGYFSLESSAKELLIRNWARNNSIDSRMLQAGMIDGKVYNNLTAEVDKSDTIPLWIDDTVNATVSHILRQATIWKARYDIKAIFVDYIQLVKVPGAQDRREQVEAATQALKDLSRRLGVAVIAAAQLKRPMKEYSETPPSLNDLQHTSALEQITDVALMLHRKVEFGQTVPVDLLVSKFRDGEKARIPLTFHGPTLKFTERVEGVYDPDED